MNKLIDKKMCECCIYYNNYEIELKLKCDIHKNLKNFIKNFKNDSIMFNHIKF